MFGSDYLLGYGQGRSSAEDERDTNALVARLFYGQRPVQVDQSYLDSLHDALSAANASSDHNYDAADRFRNEAFQWKAYAQSQENLVAPLRARITALQARLAELRDMAKAVTDAIERGEPFRGYSDEPEKKARLRPLLDELLRP